MLVPKTGIGRKTLFIFMIKLAITFISWLGVFFVARYMGSEAWGMIGFALGFTGLFLQSDYGFGLAHTKMISEGRDVGTCLGTFLQIRIVLTVILVGALLGGLYVWEHVLGYGYQDPMIVKVIMLMLAYYILLSFSLISVQTFGGLRQSVKQQVPEFIGTLFRGPFMIVVAVMSLGIIWLSLSYVISGIITIAISIFFLRKFKIKKPSRELRRSYVAFAAPLAAYVIFSTLALNLDKVILQLFWDFREVGIFFMMQKFVMIIMIGSSSLGPIFFPSISYYHSKKAHGAVRHITMRAERYMSLIITPAVAVLVPLTGPFILIFAGQDFLAGVNVLVWMSVYALFTAINIPHSYVISGYGKTRISGKIGMFIALTNIVLLFILVPRSIWGFSLFGLGATGAAMASAISMGMGFILIRKYSWQIARMRTNPRIYKHWISGMLTAIALYFITRNIWPVARWYEVGIISIMGLLIYLGILVAMKEFRKKDWNFFLDLLNPKKMMRYVGGEMRE